MRKILIRTGMSPLETPDIDHVLQIDRIGGNSGNLMFQYSVYRTLMTESTEFTSRYFRIDNCDEAFIEQVNAEYDCVILPLANCFRPDYRLRQIAAFVRRMKIPCVVIGCGLQADSYAQIRRGFAFDEAAKELVSAVLEKSAMLGLRGEMTAEYLKQLGFVPERHFTVTGCPSLFSRGAALPEVRPLTLTKDSRISINTKMKQPKALNRLISDAVTEYPDHHIVMQTHAELAMLRYGVPIVDKSFARRDGNAYYPRTDRHPAVRSGRAIAFVNARAWHMYMQQKDLCFGSRIHGNVCAVLNGTPAFVFTTDTRTEELCRYHGIAHMAASELRGGEDIRSIVEKADFNGVHRGYAQRFEHFVDFLNANSLQHIYRDTPVPQDVPFDRAAAALPEWGRIEYEPMDLRRRMMGGYEYRKTAQKIVGKAQKSLKKALKR